MRNLINYTRFQILIVGLLFGRDMAACMGEARIIGFWLENLTVRDHFTDE
jgi:hypothetical protein